MTRIEILKNWVTVILMLVFLFLYALALAGILRPMSDVTVITRLEPIMFIVVGYFLASLGTIQRERTLRDEIKRQSIRADSAQQAKQETETEKRTIEEKMRNACTALDSTLVKLGAPSNPVLSPYGLIPPARFGLAHDVATAVRILNSGG